MNIRRRTLARFATMTLGIIVLAACQPAANTGATAAAPAVAPNKAADSTPAQPPATVDGQPITHDALDFVARNNFNKKYDELGSDQQKKLVDDLVRIQLLANAALAKGKDKDADVVQAIVLGRLNVLMQATVTEYLKDKQPTEAEVRAYYEQWIKDIPKMLYRIRVIGVQTQPYADDIVSELRKGGDFVAIARREASGEAAKQNAGGSGWLSLDGISPTLANVISSLKLGEYTTEPVQLPEGWGIIRLEETRAAQKPEFDKVRQNLTRELIAKKVDTLVEELKKKARIEQPTAKIAEPAAKTG